MKGLDPTLCTHKINMKEGSITKWSSQRRACQAHCQDEGIPLWIPTSAKHCAPLQPLGNLTITHQTRDVKKFLLVCMDVGRQSPLKPSLS